VSARCIAPVKGAVGVTDNGSNERADFVSDHIPHEGANEESDIFTHTGADEDPTNEGSDKAADDSTDEISDKVANYERAHTQSYASSDKAANQHASPNQESDKTADHSHANEISDASPTHGTPYGEANPSAHE
jgi:hypothetical protein